MKKNTKIIGGAVLGVIGLSLMVAGSSTNLILLTRIGIIVTTISILVFLPFAKKIKENQNL